MDVEFVKSEAELVNVAEVLLQLRPQYTQAAIIEQIKLQQSHGYQLAYVKRVIVNQLMKYWR
ncbi:hypothetical protein [Colwellia sp. MEBiC06753]